MVAFVFFQIVISVKSLGQKQKQKKTGLQFVGWCMVNIVSKNQKPKHVKLSGAWPIYLSASDLAGPARMHDVRAQLTSS